MSVTHANGTRTDEHTVTDTIDSMAEHGKVVARRRPVALVTAAGAGLATVVVAVVTIVRRRQKPTPRQRAVNAWRRTSKTMRKRISR